MKNSKNILIVTSWMLLIGLFGYLTILQKSNALLTQELANKTKTHSVDEDQTETHLPFIDFVDAEKLIIEKIVATDRYKEDLSYTDPNTYMKFTNSGFTTDGIWFVGLIGYANVLKSTDSYFLQEGESIAMVSNGYRYILKYDSNARIEELAISHVTDKTKWNEVLRNVPNNVMSDSMKQIYLAPTNN